jgi:hypothetical protein
VMFPLPLDIATHLRNLRFTHRERAISFLPREGGCLFKRSRNPPGGIRFQFTDCSRERFVLAQFRQEVNVIGSSVYDQRDSAFASDRAAQVFVDSRPDCRLYPRLSTLGRKDNVIQEVAIGGTHTGGPFRRLFSGALLFVDTVPGVPLRSTPRFSLSHPLGAWLDQRRRRSGVKPGVERSGAPGNCYGRNRQPLKRGDGNGATSTSEL